MYEPKSFDALLGTEGFSDALLTNHFALYKGYVTNTNKLIDMFSVLRNEEKTGTPEYAELTRRFGWEYNGMRLHEYYFENIVKERANRNENAPLARALTEQYGSLQHWEKNFRATGALRGIGWTILYKDSKTGNLFNTWVTEHDMGHLAGATPLLVLDVFEHAYISDYGLKRADYINAFMNAVNWEIVEQRFDAAH
ncbi:MAG: superoxide dismutase [Patescibacteria group bacterium]|nr:superoxide dismutase [Patescibacteria group bacterium]MDE2438480.1 superoxide dismutase [Patescibacteria group bacterium]